MIYASNKDCPPPPHFAFVVRALYAQYFFQQKFFEREFRGRRQTFLAKSIETIYAYTYIYVYVCREKLLAC